jgi:hypothetical protein
MRIRRVSQCRAHGPSRLGQTEHLARQLRQTANRMEERNRIFAADFRLCRSLLRSPRRTDGPSTLTLNAKSSPTRTPHVGLAKSTTLHSQLWTKITMCRRDSPFPFQMFESEVLEAPRSPAPHSANTCSYLSFQELPGCLTRAGSDKGQGAVHVPQFPPRGRKGDRHLVCSHLSAAGAGRTQGCIWTGSCHLLDESSAMLAPAVNILTA